MLPGCLGGMGDGLLVGGINSICEGAADLTQDLHWGKRARPVVSVLQEWQEDFARVSAPRRAATGRTTVLPDGQARAPNRANHHASRPVQSHTASRYSPASRPAFADGGPSDSTRGSGWDGGRPRPRLAGRRRPVAAGATARTDPLALHRTAVDLAATHQ